MTSRSKLLRVGELSGTFPQPLVLGEDDGRRSASRWEESAVQEWLDNRRRGVQE